MKTKIKSRHLWPPRVAFTQLSEAFSCHNVFLVVAVSCLLASPVMASQPNKAQRLQSQRAIAKKLVPVPHIPSAVTSIDDSGPGSLRQALADAQDGDTITFNISPAPRPNAPSVATVITLTSGELLVNKSVTISGPGAGALTIARDANASPFRIFNISPGHTVNLQGLTISGGIAQGAFPANAGGGIYNDHSSVTLNSCVLSGNSASFGGAAFSNATSSAAVLTLNNSTVSNNSAGTSGGGIFSDGESLGNATLAANSSTVSGNTAVFGGGGVYSSGQAGSATMTLNNSTFSGNSANSFAGGIYNNGFAGNATLAISNSTLTGNSASSGGAVYLDGSNAGNAKLDIGNSIFNAGASGSNILNNGGTVISHGHNLSSDSSTGFVSPGDQLSTDPMLGPLKNNGGPTLTHAPLIYSPAIDQGKRDTIPALATNFDQRGLSRPVDDPFVPNVGGGDGSDIGAVELAVGLHPTHTASWKTHGDAGSFGISLPLPGLEIESRTGGPTNDYQVILTFAQPISFSSAAVISGVGMVSTMSATTGTGGNPGTQVTINLTGVTSAQIITFALFDVDDGTRHSDVGVRMGVLVGDVNDDGKVNATDVSQVKFQSGQPVDSENFRVDVITNGAINATDVSTVRSKSGTALPNTQS